MEKRVELEMRGKNPEEILELTLDNCRSTQIAGITDELKNLEFLSLVNVGLTTLKGFPNLANLKRLELSDNRLTGGLEHLSGCPNMTHLNLSGNKLKDVASLEPLKTLTHLKSLDLFNCEVTSEEGYREKVFEILGHLKFLDGFDKEEKECDDSDDGLDDDDEEDAGPEDGTDEEEDDPGLAYLHSDRAVVDEDETEDFELSGNNEADEDDDDDEHDDEEEESGEGAAGRGSKRKFEEETSN